MLISRTKSRLLQYPVYILYMIIFFYLPLMANAYETGMYHFDHIEKKDGLPDMTVFQITQDHQGFIWFGTRNGVARYDGIKIHSYQHDPTDAMSLSHNDAGGVIEDNSNNIWVRTWGGGLNRIDQKTGSIKVFKKIIGDKNSLSGNRVQYLYKDYSGAIWAGTFRAGLNRFVKESDTFTRFTADGQPGSIAHNRIWSITETNSNELWIGTDNGLHLYNPEKQTFSVYYYTDQSGNSQGRYLILFFLFSRLKIRSVPYIEKNQVGYG